MSEFGFNSSEGSLVTEFSVIADSGSPAYVNALTDGTTNNMILQFRETSTQLRTGIVSGGSDDTAALLTATTSANTLIKFASAFKDDDISQSLNGASVNVDTSATIPSGIASLRLGNRDDNARPLNGHIKSIKYYPRRLTNAQLQELTS